MWSCPRGSLLIGAFNIKSFGDKKASNATLVDLIVKIVHRYDIVLIQEVRDSDLSATKKLMQQVNRGSSPYIYSHIFSEPLGRSTYKERYLYIYREEMVSVARNFTFDDGCEPCGTDTFNREPFVVMFSSRYSAVREFAPDPSAHFSRLCGEGNRCPYTMLLSTPELDGIPTTSFCWETLTPDVATCLALSGSRFDCTLISAFIG
ncbi:hypothetical protein SKAU_G00292720 [Synaphobranchus kaupii]|uniref:Endonuclease/exonuclease/phosphatase domain-containing protein n=1 Tax=Synaphobranchus kaupii TaxID=118154 RepID=A0A9Q1EU76_SYNKA|nr:hypothetical protein SKAU_G00292720 [Synaphobranchus kaupii]